MTVSRQWVAQVKAVVADIREARRPAATAENEAWRGFQHYAANTAQLVVEQTPRARAEREITRIATWYGLQGEVVRHLDAAGVVSLGGLQECAADQLLDRMRLLEDNIQNGGDAPDAPAAR